MSDAELRARRRDDESACLLWDRAGRSGDFTGPVDAIVTALEVFNRPWDSRRPIEFLPGDRAERLFSTAELLRDLWTDAAPTASTWRATSFAFERVSLALRSDNGRDAILAFSHRPRDRAGPVSREEQATNFGRRVDAYFPIGEACASETLKDGAARSWLEHQALDGLTIGPDTVPQWSVVRLPERHAAGIAGELLRRSFDPAARQT